MIEPGQRILDAVDRRGSGHGRPAQHDHRKAECARRSDLAIGGSAAAVLGNDAFDAVRGKQRALVGFGKRTAASQILRMRDGERRLDRIDTADQIVVLRSCDQRIKLTAAERDEDATWRLAKRRNRVRDTVNQSPAITGDGRPGRPPQDDDGHRGVASGRKRIRRNDGRVRMRGVDQGVDTLTSEIVSKALSSAETADAYRHRLRCRRCGAAGERRRDVEFGARGEAPGENPGFRRAAEDKDAWHVSA